VVVLPYCPKCGKEIEASATFCSNCGMQLSVTPIEGKPSQARYCQYCGKELTIEANFCLNCGKLVRPQTPPTPPRVPVVAPIQAGLNFKNEGLTSLLSLFGIGHIYLGKLKRGIVILAILILSFWIASSYWHEANLLSDLYSRQELWPLIYDIWGITPYTFSGRDKIKSMITGFYVIATASSIVFIGLWIWQIFDAHKLAKYYNEYLRTHGKTPW